MKRTNVKKMTVTLNIEISDECIRRVDNGMEEPVDPYDFVKTELGWAAESFDGFIIKEMKEIKDLEEDLKEDT